MSYIYSTSFGPLRISSTGDAISEVRFIDAVSKDMLSSQEEPTEIMNRCINQILEFLSGHRRAFDIEMMRLGSDFQRSVWKASSFIPYGQTRTYAEIAEVIGSPTSYRMVGRAVKENPLQLLIPTHRIIASNGRKEQNDALGKLNARLLELEQTHL